MIDIFVSDSGGGLTEADADAIYLRLDCANDPVVGNGGNPELHLQCDLYVEATTDGVTTDNCITIENTDAAGYARWSGPLYVMCASTGEADVNVFSVGIIDSYALSNISTEGYRERTTRIYNNTAKGAAATGAVVKVGRITNGNSTLRGWHDAIILAAPNSDVGGQTGAIYAGTMLPLTNAMYSIGAPDSMWANTYFAPNTATGLPLDVSTGGNIWTDATKGLAYVGMDNIYPDYYCQRIVKYGSVVTDNSEDASNLYQGNWGNGATPSYPFLELNYRVGDFSVGGVGIGADGITYVRDGAVLIGNSTNTYGGGGLVIFSNASGRAMYMYGDNATNSFVFRTISDASGKSSFWMSSISFAGTRLSSVKPLTDATVDLGIAATNRWKNLYLSGTITCASSTNAYTASNVTTDRTYDANATSIDELADVVGTLIADLKTAGIIS